MAVPNKSTMGDFPPAVADALIAVSTQLQGAKGTDLTDAAATIQIAAGNWRVLPAATLTTARVLTLGTTGAVAGDQITITRLDATANTYTIANGGGGGGNLVVMPVSKVNFALCQFDGTDWLLRQAGTQ